MDFSFVSKFVSVWVEKHEIVFERITFAQFIVKLPQKFAYFGVDGAAYIDLEFNFAQQRRSKLHLSLPSNSFSSM